MFASRRATCSMIARARVEIESAGRHQSKLLNCGRGNGKEEKKRAAEVRQNVVHADNSMRQSGGRASSQVAAHRDSGRRGSMHRVAIAVLWLVIPCLPPFHRSGSRLNHTSRRVCTSQTPGVHVANAKRFSRTWRQDVSLQASRMIGSAILGAGGAIAIGIGDLAFATYSSGGGGERGIAGGVITLVAGGLLFTADWVASWLSDRMQSRQSREQEETG